MNTIWSFIAGHQVIFTLAGGYTWSAFISALPAPTAFSGPVYRFFFSFFNVLAANISRAKDSSIESSANFLPAAQKAQDLGQLSKP